MITRGTTPTITVHLDSPADDLDLLFLTIAQAGGKIIMEKQLSEGVTSGNSVIFSLTQEDTLLLSDRVKGEMQVTGKRGEYRFTSDVIKVDIGRILKDGVI